MRIVVKVGTSTLAHPGGLLNIRHTEDLVRVWSDIQNAGHQLIVVSSAATGLGAGKLQIEKPGDLAALLTNLQEGDVLFIDEIRRGGPVRADVYL